MAAAAGPRVAFGASACASLLALSAAVAGCADPAWPSHRAAVSGVAPFSSINATNLPVASSLYGVEGGHMVAVGGALYIAIAEFTAPPHFVPSKIALWRGDPAPAGQAWPTAWTRVSTLFESTGKVDCVSLRASLGSSVALAYNGTAGRFELFYVGFKACNDSTFVNRDGRIFRAVSSVAGNTRKGVEGRFVDTGVAMAPGPDSAPWEGEQGVDSMQPYSLGPGRGWAAFYGSANTQDPQPLIRQTVGQTFAPTLAGPWRRANTSWSQPCNLSALAPRIEQPMVTRLRDGTFVALFDALESEAAGDVGYAWSRDGVTWDPECSQLLDVGVEGGWLSRRPGGGGGRGRARTPQGVVELNSGALLLSFSGYDGGADNPMHESLGFATLELGRSRS